MSCTGVVKSNEALVSWERRREREKGGGGGGDEETEREERERREEKRNLSVFCIHDSFSQH